MRFRIEALLRSLDSRKPPACPYLRHTANHAVMLRLLNKDWFDIRLVDPETDEEVEVGSVGYWLGLNSLDHVSGPSAAR